MWNAVIELALGLIVLYSVLSLVTSNVNELIATAFSQRGRNLRKAVKHMVGDDCADRVYAHPLVRTLYMDRPPGEADPRFMATLRRRLPSYIPAEKFVIALLDSAVPSAVKAPPPLPPEPRVLIPTQPPSPGQEEEEEVEEAREPSPSSPNWQDLIGSELGRLGGGRLGDTLRSIWAAASYDVVAFRAGVEDWFNDTMDRASGWYKRRTQALLLALALMISVGLNVDTIQVAQRLWTDGPLRAAVADEVKKLPVAATTTTPQSAGPTAGTIEPGTTRRRSGSWGRSSTPSNGTYVR